MLSITTSARTTRLEEIPSMHAASRETKDKVGVHTLRLWFAALLVVSMGLIGAQTARSAPLGISSFTAGAYNADGTPATQAGSHPWELATSFAFNTETDNRTGTEVATASVKDTVVDLPAGAIGNPTGVPQCRQQDLDFPQSSCPTNTQVGYAEVDVDFFGRSVQHVPIYNMIPPSGEPAQFGFVVTAAVAHIDVHVRTDGDYGVRATVHNSNAGAVVFGATIHLWGVPADPSHDVWRYRPIFQSPGDENGNPLPSTAPRVALLRNPTECTGESVTTGIRAASWQQPDQFVSATAQSPALTGCENLPFDPSVTVRPDTRKAGSGAGLNVDVDLPQSDDPDTLASADLKRSVVKLPAGIGINPSASDGLQGCADQDFALRSTDEDRCPDASKIGSVQVTSPLLKAPLTGAAFLASPLEQGPTAAANGRMFRLFLTAQGSGVRVKLTGSVVPDPLTGQLTATFDNNPQLPFTNLHVELVGGDRAPLSSPKQCGTYTTTAELAPWSAPNAPVTTSSSFVIDQNCDRAAKFEPSLEAGLTNPVAAGSSPFSLTVSRPDGQQDINGVNVVLPPGLLARVGSVAQCGDADAAAGTCSVASQIGHAIVAAGAGPNPVYVPQAGKAPTAVYLTGPYKGAPYGLSVVVPAQAGPYDLGTVVVRAALRVDPIDAHVTVDSDPLPTMLLGVPLNVQKINVVIDRPGFMVSPTNCKPMQVSATVSSPGGATANLTNRFQIGDCAKLRLAPKLGLTLTGKGQTTDGKHPGVDAVLAQGPGQAQLKKVVVTLPKSLALDPDNAQALCEFADGSKVDPTCPKASIVGTATAKTPLLNQPLSGPVYFVKNIRIDKKSGRQIRTLPKIVIPLTGENGLRLNLVGTSDVVADRLVTTFDNIPDAPVSSFALNITGGKHGILVVSNTDVCKATQTAARQIDGQNGKTADANLALQTPDCRLKILSKTLGRTSVAVKVGGLSAGRLIISGHGITKTSRTIATSTVATITAKRTTGRPGKVTVAFRPAGAKKAKTVSASLN